MSVRIPADASRKDCRVLLLSPYLNATSDGAAGINVEQLLHNLTIFLDCDHVHGDLSPYNILYWQDRLQIIDFPQAVDALDNPHAFGLLARDVEIVPAYFAPHGILADSRRLALKLWLDSG